MRLLTEDELEALTGRKRSSAQAKALRSMGIDFRTRPDGKIIVIDLDLPIRKQNDPSEPEFTIAA
jgi:hypothetical protein